MIITAQDQCLEFASVYSGLIPEPVENRTLGPAGSGISNVDTPPAYARGLVYHKALLIPDQVTTLVSAPLRTAASWSSRKRQAASLTSCKLSGSIGL